MMSLSFLSVALTAICTALRDDYSVVANKDHIESLPGLKSSIFKKYSMFSGYIDLYDNSNRSIFYWFVESLNDPKKDPVTLWTNGGPGVSGLTGMFLSLGPFRPMKNGSLRVQPYSWVNVANMLFVEQPAGVGFSILDDPNFTHTDNSTAKDNYHFISRWLKKYPNYKANDFYIASESYGGHFMPTLAQEIVQQNQAGSATDEKINLRGVFVNNPFTDPVENQRGHYETLYGHQIIGKPTFEQWKEACHYGADNANVTQECHDAQSAIFHSLVGPMNAQQLDYPICIEDSYRHRDEVYAFYKHRASSGAIIPPIYSNMIEFFEANSEEQWYFDPEIAKLKEMNYGVNDLPEVDGFAFNPCEDKYLNKWLNKADVQKAIHAISREWTPSATIKYAPDNPHASGVQPIWQWLLDNADLNLLIVSGDNDAVVGTFGTQMWMWDMGWEVDDEYNWRMWLTSDTQCGGWYTKFKKGVNLLTIHSAGHALATTQPKKTLEAWTRYLEGEF